MHVVSMLEVPTMLGSVSFQSNDVRGAQNSEFLFWRGGGRRGEGRRGGKEGRGREGEGRERVRST